MHSKLVLREGKTQSIFAFIFAEKQTVTCIKKCTSEKLKSYKFLALTWKKKKKHIFCKHKFALKWVIKQKKKTSSISKGAHKTKISCSQHCVYDIKSL